MVDEVDEVDEVDQATESTSSAESTSSPGSVYDRRMTAIRPLTGADFPEVHRAFLEAFSDYAVPLTLSADDLREMIARRGWVPGASVGVFEGDRMVAFTLNGVGSWKGVPTGYDTGTGVVPSHRSRGLSRRMLEASYDLLRGQGARQYLLEVLQSNERAFEVYRRVGFEVTRRFQCWTCEPHDAGDRRVTPTEAIDLGAVRALFDVEPSWQNSIESLLRARAPRTTLAVFDGEALAGCAVVFANGDLPLLAVAPAHRRRGIGRSLLVSAASAAGKPLRILNVEIGYEPADRFLRACGAVETVRQYEMVRAL